MHTTNYTDTLILPSPDCTAEVSMAPAKPGAIATLQHGILIHAPYTITSDELLVQVTAERRGLEGSDHDDLREELFSKGQACLRASPLVKTHGWAVHHDAQMRVALVGQHTEAFARLSADDTIKKTAGMRSSRKA